MQSRSWLLAFTLVAFACGNDTGRGGTDSDGGLVDAAPVDGVPPTVVQFQRDVVPILNRSCGTGTDGCHNRKTYGANLNMDCRGWLTLENAALGSMFYAGSRVGESTGCPDKTLHERLTTIDVWQCQDGARRKYAKANDVAGSYILDKMRGTNLCNEDGQTTLSSKMPPLAKPGEMAFTIPDGDILTIENWIMAGAKND